MGRFGSSDRRYGDPKGTGRDTDSPCVCAVCPPESWHRGRITGCPRPTIQWEVAGGHLGGRRVGHSVLPAARFQACFNGREGSTAQHLLEDLVAATADFGGP